MIFILIQLESSCSHNGTIKNLAFSSTHHHIFYRFVFIVFHIFIESDYYSVSSWKNLFTLTYYPTEQRFHESVAHTDKDNKLPKVLVILGTRPEGIKCAPLIAELKSDRYRSRFQVFVLSTSQHRQILKQTLSTFHQTIDIDLSLMVHSQKLTDLCMGSILESC